MNIDERLFQSLFLLMDDGVTIYEYKNNSFYFLDANEKAMELESFEKMERIGKSMYLFYPPQEFEQLYSLCIESLNENKSMTFERKTSIIEEIKLFPIENQYIALIGRDITKRKIKEENLLHLAFHDPLTDLPNRRLFTEQLNHILYRTERNETPFALLLLDCDGFKRINDTYGHDIGDEVIKGFATRVKQLIRKSDILARFGGDEFALLFPEVHSKEDVEILSERIIEKIQEPWHFGSITFQTSTSIGAYYCDPKIEKSFHDIHDAIKKADIALYKAKHSGKNNCQFYKKDITIKE